EGHDVAARGVREDFASVEGENPSLREERHELRGVDFVALEAVGAGVTIRIRGGDKLIEPAASRMAFVIAQVDRDQDVAVEKRRWRENPRRGCVSEEIDRVGDWDARTRRLGEARPRDSSETPTHREPAGRLHGPIAENVGV